MYLGTINKIKLFFDGAQKSKNLHLISSTIANQLKLNERES